jgi:hypothetical protein
LSLVLLVWGIAQYGLSLEVQQRFRSDIFARATGPMTFRFYLQPTMALIAAVHDGLRDTRFGHHSFFWTAADDTTKQAGRLREGVRGDRSHRAPRAQHGRDLPDQGAGSVLPVEALMMAILLAVVPYFIFRWIVEGVSRWSLARRGTGSRA